MISGVRKFLESYKESSATPFLIVYGFFLLSRMPGLLFWGTSMILPVSRLSQYLRASALWLMFVYLAFLFVFPNVNIRKILLAGTASGLAMVFCTAHLQSGFLYEVLTTLLILLLSYGRSFQRMMKTALIIHAATLAAGLAGCLAGFTISYYKFENYGQGFAFGMNYPNTFARMIFIILVLVWALYLKNRKSVLTFLAFWAALIPVFFGAKCRTAAILLFLFPLCALVCNTLSKEKTEITERRLLPAARIPVWIPVACWAATMILAACMEPLESLTADTALYNFSVRFIQAGIAIKRYGLSLFPQNLALNGSITAILAGREERLLYLDSCYAYYTLRYGLLFVGVILFWLCIVNRCCIKKKDAALLLIAVFMDIYGMMERVPMMPEHNFMLFYPLAAAALAGKDVS